MPRTTIISDPYVNIAGADTEIQFTTALEQAGCSTTGPDAKGEYSSQCPAHADTVASLRWRVAIDGRVLFDCHAGCEYKDVVSALELEYWQLQPTKVEYDYTDKDGEYLFTVVRTFGADGKKGFKQGRRTADGWVANVDGVDTAVLWRRDEIERAERGSIHTLWLAEGEKDAAVIALGLQGREGEYSSTFPGGAKRETDEAMLREIAALGVKTLVVVVDRDKSGAGQKRGRRIARAMGELPDVAVRIMIPVEGAGKDVGELVDRFGIDGWEPRLEAMAYDAAEDELLDYGATFAAGNIVVARPEVGRNVMCMVRPGKEEAPVAVLTGVIEPDAVHTSAAVGRKYAITITPQIHVADPLNATVTSADLSSSQAFLRWLSRIPDFGRAPMSGVPVGDIADGLRMYLDYRVRIAGKPVLVSPEACGWVDAETGVVADRAGTGRELAFVDRDGRIITATTSKVDAMFAEPETRHGGEYGVELSELEVAWAFWQALTFADADVTAPVAGFIGATVLSPFMAAAGAGLRPGLTIVAPSGSGKTHGAASLLLGLAGCSGHQSGSAAGMRRKLESGVGTMLWFDDTAAVEETRMKEWMRVAITRSEFTLSDTDAGTNAVHGGGLTAVPVVSSEGIGWLAETAMRDRFIAVHPTNPQGRKSLWPGREYQAQWSDVQAVEVGLLGGRPTRGAGRVVAGLVAAMAVRGRGSVFAGVKEALAAASEGGVRREWARACAQVGLEAVIAWLERVRDDAGDSWPGHGAGPWANSLQWLRDGWTMWANLNEDPTAEAACSLVDEVVPRLLQAHYDSARTHKGASPYALVGVSMTGKNEATVAIKAAVTAGAGSSGIERGLPPIIVDSESFVWVRSSACASEYRRLVRTAEERTTGAAALAGQTNSRAVCDDPVWATFIKGKRVQSGCRARVDGVGEAIYRRLSRVASDRAMAAARW